MILQPGYTAIAYACIHHIVVSCSHMLRVQLTAFEDRTLAHLCIISLFLNKGDEG